MNARHDLDEAVSAALADAAGPGVILGESLVLCEALDTEGDVRIVALSQITSTQAQWMLDVLGHVMGIRRLDLESGREGEASDDS